MGEERRMPVPLAASIARWAALTLVSLATIGLCIHYTTRTTVHPPHLRMAYDVQTFRISLDAYYRDLGAYPPDDVESVGGATEYGTNEVIHYYLGRKHLVNENFYGPYASFKESRLTDEDQDGFPEYRDPRGCLYLYVRREDWPQGGASRGYDLVNAGPDGILGGRMVPGKGYVPATSPEGKAAEADNITNW